MNGAQSVWNTGPGAWDTTTQILKYGGGEREVNWPFEHTVISAV